jgi:uncharacterized protein (TIGR02301 family)
MTIFRPIFFAFAVLASLPAVAQAPAQDRAPYETALSQLAEILGALHYLRPLCGASEQGQWRNEMQALIDAAQLPPDKRNLLVTSFNRGYVAYEQTYRSCTPAASLAIRRFLDEGARLSRDIATRYSN